MADTNSNPPAGEVLTPELMDALLQRARRIQAKRGQVVIGDSDPTTDVYLVEEGVAQVSLYSADGKEAIFREIGKGEIFGEMAAIDGLPRSATVIALTDCVLGQVSATSFKQFVDEVPTAGLWMARQLVSRIRDMTDRSLELATMPAPQRIYSEILRMVSRSASQEDEVTITGFPTHAEFAARIGTQRETVSRELGWLADNGFVAKERHALTVISVGKLRALLANV